MVEPVDPVGVQNADTSSCRTPFVLMNESAEDVSPADPLAIGSLGSGRGIGRTKVDAPVRPGQIVVLCVRAEDAM